MTIHWHKRASAALHEVEAYVSREFGEAERQEFMDEVERDVAALAAMPSLGTLDPLFSHRKQAYRYIIVRRLNKVVYYVKGDVVHVAGFWDTRREPKKQAQQTR